MEPIESAGFKERPHTADWSLDVWAQSLPGLLEQAAYGMYALMETRLASGPHLRGQLKVEADDAEGLLVTFLSELLYIGEREGLAFDKIVVELKDLDLSADLEGAPIVTQSKEIKAVTYHNLEIRKVDKLIEATLTFDV